jgi:hypothetical protein
MCPTSQIDSLLPLGIGQCIAVNIAKLPELLRPQADSDTAEE